MKRRLAIGVCALLLWPASVLAQDSPTPQPQPASTSNAAIEAAVKNQEDIAAKKAEIAAIDQKINELKSKRDTTAAQAELISRMVTKLQQQLQQAQLELKQTELTIKSVNVEQQQTENTIDELEDSLKVKREQLRGLIRALYDQEEQSLIHVFLSSSSLSEMLAIRDAYEELQNRQVMLMQEIQAKGKELQQKQLALQQQQQDLGNLQEVLAVQQQGLAVQRQEQEKFLKAKTQEKLQYENKIAEAKQARQEIEQRVFTLKSSGIKLSLTEATDIAKYASKITGVRAALLLGVLKVETNLGTNIGNGVYPDDMLPASREAFLRVTKKLGLDPNTAPISARPRSYQGWGGAMGPGQFMPDTWERIEERVAKIMNKDTANPYDLTDAFVATAVFLADKGATNKDLEYEAVNRYLAGPNWQRFTWYGDRVLAVAQEYEKEGL